LFSLLLPFSCLILYASGHWSLAEDPLTRRVQRKPGSRRVRRARRDFFCLRSSDLRARRVGRAGPTPAPRVPSDPRRQCCRTSMVARCPFWHIASAAVLVRSD